MQDISIVSSLSCPPRTDQIILGRSIRFEGLRDSRTIADRHTRVRVAMPAASALGLYQLLGNVVNEQVE